MYLFSVLLLYFELWYIYIHSTIVAYTCLHYWFYNYNDFLINQYIDHQSSRVLGAALFLTSLIACMRSALCVLGGRQMPFGQTRCTLTCIQAPTALHSDNWPLQSRTDLQDDIDHAGTTKNRTFCCSNLVNVYHARTTKNRTFCYSNLVNVDHAGTTKNKTFCCSNLVNVNHAGTTKNRTFCCSNLVNVDHAGIIKNRTFCCSNLVKPVRNTKLKCFFIQK
jgi:hypothetical protein